MYACGSIIYNYKNIGWILENHPFAKIVRKLHKYFAHLDRATIKLSCCEISQPQLQEIWIIISDQVDVQNTNQLTNWMICSIL